MVIGKSMSSNTMHLWTFSQFMSQDRIRCGITKNLFKVHMINFIRKTFYYISNIDFTYVLKNAN